MHIYQYWDQPEPPAEVSVWLDGFRADNPEMTHHVLNRKTATEFIALHFGPREVEAFSRCGPPAMQADYLRLCLMRAVGGIYLDADQTSGEPLASFLTGFSEAMICRWYIVMSNTVMVFRQPGDAFINAALDLATDNVLARRFHNVLASTGPPVLNAVWSAVNPEIEAAIEATVAPYWRPHGWDELLEQAKRLVRCKAEVRSALTRIALIQTDDCVRWFGLTSPDYKKGDRHWENWPGSIYS